jgi:hypothetical protein
MVCVSDRGFAEWLDMALDKVGGFVECFSSGTWQNKVPDGATQWFHECYGHCTR